MYSWSPWEGCHKISAGCQHCYLYGKKTKPVTKTASFDKPVQKNKNGEYRWKSGNVVAMCFSSDFFIEEADEWREEAWKMIEERCDLHFFMITKRIDRFYIGLPENWKDGYKNVTICTTMENQETTDYQMPVFRDLPIVHKMIACEPLLERIDLSPYLGKWVKQIVAGGESGKEARPCNCDWIMDIRRQCIDNDIPFQFRQTGSNFIKDGIHYPLNRAMQYSQAQKADINYKSLPVFYSKQENAENIKIYYPTYTQKHSK